MNEQSAIVFVCPLCEKTLQVRRDHVGRRGRCRVCGGYIALIGRADAEGPQMATAVAEGPPEAPSHPGLPPSEGQLQYLRKLGAAEEDLAVLDRETASALIDQMTSANQRQEPPTEKQWAYLKRLGADARQLARVTNKAEASALIEAMHLTPTPEQRARLRELGATGAQVASLRTKAAAAALIEDLQTLRP